MLRSGRAVLRASGPVKLRPSRVQKLQTRRQMVSEAHVSRRLPRCRRRCCRAAAAAAAVAAAVNQRQVGRATPPDPDFFLPLQGTDQPLPACQRSAPVLLLDVMDTIVRDPFYEEMPRFFNTTFQNLIQSKHPTAWLQVAARLYPPCHLPCFELCPDPLLCQSAYPPVRTRRDHRARIFSHFLPG